MKKTYKNLIFTLIFIGVAILTFLVGVRKIETGINYQLEDIKATTEHFELVEVNHIAVFTAYTLSEDETDGSPCIGAGNNNLCELKPELEKQGISICASRDLPLDTLIYIDGIGECIIKDRMNIRYKGTYRIDILMDSKADAKIFGIRQLNYIIIK